MRVGIIGGGITGSYSAMKLAEAGHEVMVFEKKAKPGKEACSGLISNRIWDFVPEKKRLVEHKINKAMIYFPKKVVEFDFDPEMLVINRPALDRYVADLAKKSGARFFFKHEFKRVFRHKSSKPQVSIGVGKKTMVMEFDRLIGADGALSKLREQSHVKSPDYRLGLGFYQRKKSKAKAVEIWPMDKGFAWKIPRGNRTEYGILDDPKVTKKDFDKFLKKRKVRKQKLFSAVIPRGLALTDKKYIALVGDAAGLAKPWSGGGVIWGLKGAQMLTETFPDFRKYHRKANRFFAPKVFYSKVAEKVGLYLGKNYPKLVPNNFVIDSDWVF
ncbi:MAG: NAD(P)-binding protein, partial [Candidatus Aenigmarchaeota archaeon]|nr:NAD(P)-binding protein [Candidatus Aenigmarchaeota archaeon]